MKVLAQTSSKGPHIMRKALVPLIALTSFLAACGGAQDASDEATAENVEFPADAAMDGAPDPVADAALEAEMNSVEDEALDAAEAAEAATAVLEEDAEFVDDSGQ